MIDIRRKTTITKQLQGILIAMAGKQIYFRNLLSLSFISCLQIYIDVVKTSRNQLSIKDVLASYCLRTWYILDLNTHAHKPTHL